MHRAASAASELAKHAYAVTHGNSDLELLPLKCCLMSISLPWELIAHDLLFKVSSLVLYITETFHGELQEVICWCQCASFGDYDC